jgi:PAS domain S-box-containing protein
MLSGWLLSALAVTYLGCLFGIAFYGDRHSVYPERRRLRPYIYSLALGVYCTSWTFFGAVGTAVRDGWGYLPIYLGPALVFFFALPFIKRLVEAGRAHKVTSIADFIASRFGKSRALAALVTVIAFTATIPYLALQYKAVSASVAVLTATTTGPAPWFRDTALGVALLMSLFAVLFGARRVDATEHHEGLMLAIAFESLLKLLAFVAVGVFAILQLRGHPFVLPAGLAKSSTLLNANALETTLLAAMAIFCLPRQFQVGVVECASASDLKQARWLLPGYLGLFSAFAVPIVALGVGTSMALPGGSDSLILSLPMSFGASWLAALVFLGGLSAATAMVVVASVALSTMISNDIAVPLLWQERLEAGASLGRRVLWVRRVVIVVLALLAFTYYRATSGSPNLASIGILAFAAVAQFAPGIVAALYWGGATREGVFWGMLAGFLVWGYLLFIPNLLAGGVLAANTFAAPHSLAWLWPHTLLHAVSLGQVGPGALSALLLNIFVLVVVSARRGVTLQERVAARNFVSPNRSVLGLPAITAQVADLESVAARIIGTSAARQALDDYLRSTPGAPARPTDAADRGMLQHFERVLAGSIGASSARVVLTHALKRKGLGVDEVAELLDEASQELRFSRQLLQATMENVTQGISVVDSEMRLVAWNRRYLQMFAYPDGMVHVGRPVADLIRLSAQRGELGPGDPEQHVQRRLDRMRAGSAYTFQRQRLDGHVYNIHGQPMSGGGFVTTYSDITEFKRTEQALREAKQGLEERVERRTHELSEALEAQRSAKQQAEAANASKTRFVAAASHDLLQPLNAARLFASALEARATGHPELLKLASRIDGSMRAAEELLKDLLDIARLDTGVLQPELSNFSLHELLEDLQHQYAPLAASRQLRLIVAPTDVIVRSDRTLLRRIVQNYISNALRYTQRGGVLIGARRHNGGVEICVYDTGPGITSEQRKGLYAEFSRAQQDSPWGERGLGLGLSICHRFAGLMNHELTLRSRRGHGSVFGVRVPRELHASLIRAPASRAPIDPTSLRDLRVLCVDNDLSILDGMEALLGQWGVQVFKASSSSQALAMVRAHNPEVVLADYHLGDELNGLELLKRLSEVGANEVTMALITADHGPKLAQTARERGVRLLHKPLRPAALRALLTAFRRVARRTSAA